MIKDQATLLNNIDKLILEAIKFDASRRKFLKTTAATITAPVLHSTVKKVENIANRASAYTSGPIERVADKIEKKLNSSMDRRDFLGRTAEITAGSTILGRVWNKVKNNRNELSTS